MKSEWKKFIPACALGNTLELFEFIIYGYFASIIGLSFFPTHNYSTALIEAFAVFATGSLVRPFSAVIFGYIGDKLGRRLSLILSIGIMSLSTFCVGILPTYAVIGIFSPMLLILCRVGQALSMTGEQVGAAVYLTESAPKSQQGYASSWILGTVYLGLVVGSLLAALIFALFSGHQLQTFGWRIPFLLGGLFGFFILLLRIKQPESAEYKSARQHHLILQNPLIILFKKHWITLLKTTFLFSLLSVAVYLFAVFIPNMIHVSGMSKIKIMLISASCCLSTFIVSLIVGKWVDKVGTQLPLIISAVGFIIFSYPIFWMLGSHDIKSIIVGYLIFSVFLGFSAGSVMLAVTQSFPLNVRFSGSCVAFNLAMSVFGGTAPLLALYLSKVMDAKSAPALILMGAGLITLIFLMGLKTSFQFWRKTS